MQGLRDVASNQMATQQVEVKDNRLQMNGPHTESLGLDAMTPKPGKRHQHMEVRPSVARKSSVGFQPSGMTPQHREVQPSVRASIENLEELKQDT